MATEEHSIDIDDEYSTLDDDEEVIVEGASSYTESLVCSDVELNTDCKINDSGKEKCISDRGNFFDFVIDYTKDLDNLIIGGDFNTSLSVLDRGSKTCHMNDEPYRKLTKLMDDNNLYDIWRARNPDCRIFSWKRISEGKLQQSRIDYFLVSRNMSSFVQSLYYNVTSMSDHSFVIMNLNCTCIERGPGLWVLNNTLLFNEEYVQRVKDIISQEKESELFHRDFLVWWDNLKYRIKRYSQILSSDLAKQNKRDNKESIPEVFKEFDLYSKATGAKINRQKSEILCLGTGTLSVVEKDHIGLKVCEDYFQLLGVFIGKNRKMCDEMNWKNKIVKIKSLLNIWLLRRFTIHGRVSVINSLMLSRFWYALFVTALPEWAYIEIKRLCLNFIWKNRCHLVKYNCIVDDKSRGGLNVADIKCKIYAFRLKFLGRLLDDEYEVLWKYTFKYFVSSIYDMKLCHNVFYTVIPNCELKKLPVVYQEFFQALNCIREKIEFPLSVENIYDQPLFVNPNIVLNNRTIVWHDFIGAGIVCLKDICFEVKTGFLPDLAIVEMIQVVYEDVNVQYVVDRYRNLLNVIPVEWKNTVNTDIHRISIPRTIDISIICKNVHYDLKLCSTKTLYTIMLENIVEEPVGIELWKSVFNVSSEAFSKIWEHVNMYWKPSNLVELDFKVLHNCIFTNVKLQKIGLVDDNICKVCCSEKEDILHIFMNCDKLEDFHNYLSSLLVRIFENCDSDKISLVRSEELLILGLRWHMKGVNDTFLNFFMSVARYCIFRRRNLLNSGYSNCSAESITIGFVWQRSKAIYLEAHMLTHRIKRIRKESEKQEIFERLQLLFQIGQCSAATTAIISNWTVFSSKYYNVIWMRSKDIYLEAHKPTHRMKRIRKDSEKQEIFERLQLLFQIGQCSAATTAIISNWAVFSSKYYNVIWMTSKDIYLEAHKLTHRIKRIRKDSEKQEIFERRIMKDSEKQKIFDKKFHTLMCSQVLGFILNMD
ncbi:unnamed protein product [Mytilus coruscus]|uniref:Uncharacterized protein n=1 Tax=Mytilus coruscus TaxID=42192 RepID=A0A6J8DTS0_MYTCO|nr:unnamed protein product [Mytilus coruscus]